MTPIKEFGSPEFDFLHVIGQKPFCKKSPFEPQNQTVLIMPIHPIKYEGPEFNCSKVCL